MSSGTRTRIVLGLLAGAVIVAVVAVALLWRPVLSLYLTVRASTQEESGDLDGAEQSYLMALGHDPESFRAYTGLGVIYRKRGRCREAAAQYRRAIELNPAHADAYSSLGVIHLLWKEYDAAIPLLEKAAELAPDYDVPAANLAIGYHYAGRTEDRDRLAARAAALGYPNMDALDAIFEDELTIHTREACAADPAPTSGP